MELFDVIEDQIEELELNSYRRIPRARIFRNRVDHFVVFDEQDFFARFRLSKRAANHVHDLIKNKINPRTKRNRAVSSKIRFLLTLRYLATGSFLRAAADFSGVSAPTASRIVKEVTEAIAQLNTNIIKFPEDIIALQEGFYKIARFPRVLAAIDYTHVTIKSPGGDSAENYRNRKSTFSINVQMACDSQLRCMNIVARWPGSVHDQTIFNNSSLKHKFENGEFGNGLLLGDSGYEAKNYLLTPISNPMTHAENLYNESHIRTRNTIETCFGVCKNRFPVLRRQITLSLKNVQAVIVACVVLHNIAIDYNETHFGDHHDSETDSYVSVAPSIDLNTHDATRRMVHEYFASLLNSY